MSAASARVRRYRQRQRAGQRVFPLTLATAGVEELLRHEHMLSATGEHSDREIDEALAEYIRALIAIARGA